MSETATNVRIFFALLFSIFIAAPASAQVVAIALDPKPELIDGELKIDPHAVPDSVVFYRFHGTTAEFLGGVDAPNSFQGPPAGMAVNADATLALVGVAVKADPETRQELVPDNRLSVIELGASSIHVAQTLELPGSPAAVAINPAGTLAIVTLPDEDGLSILSIAGNLVEATAKVELEKGAHPLGVAFSPDGRTVLVALAGGNRVALFSVEGERLQQPAVREMSVGVWPAALSICGQTGLAVVANYGRGTGDADSISLMDIAATPPHVVDIAAVGPSPEGVACSTDGRYVVVATQNMSTVARSDPFFSEHSEVVLFKIEGRRLQRQADAKIGGWAQGVEFLGDSRTLFAQSMNDRSLHFFKIENDQLRPAAPPMRFEHGAPAAYGIQRP